MSKPKISKKELARLHRVFNTAQRFTDAMVDIPQIDAHDKANVCAIMLSELLKHVCVDHGVEAVDDLLCEFLATFSEVIEPCIKNDPMLGINVSLSITRKENEE
jgi:hypothetical protein